MSIAGKLVRFQVDCGASVNLITLKYVSKAKMKPPTNTLEMWDKNLKSPVGEAMLKMVNPANDKTYSVKFVVVEDDDLMPVLGVPASQKMGLISVNSQNFERIAVISKRDATDVTGCPIITKFKDVFNDNVGNLTGTATLRVDPTVTPTISPSRRVPVALRLRIKAELDSLTKWGIIKPVSEPTDWVSAMVTATKKSGELRICNDPRPLNKALKREHFPLCTLDDVLPELSDTQR